MPPLSAVGISGLQAGEDVNVTRDGETFHREIRLDVNERRWVG